MLFHRLLRLGLFLGLSLSFVFGMLAIPAVASPVDEPTLQVIDDFETPLVSGQDSDGVPIGFFVAQDGNSTTTFAQTDAPPAAVPDLSAPNNVLEMNFTISSFGVVIHNFANETVDTWTPQDWSTYEGVGFWLYGNNSGTDLFVDIIDNRSLNSTVDNAERYTVTFQDDFTGWQYLQFPFDDFVRKDIGNGAPNDGFTLTSVHGWAFGTLTTDGTQTYYLDQITLYDNGAPTPPGSDWQLVWSDEFNEPAGTPPNPTIWTPEIGDGTIRSIPGWGNSELQYYTDSPDNAVMDGDGNLVITVRETDENSNLICYYGPCEYTSARLITENKVEFAYGRIEMGVQLPRGAGLWPAFWSLGTNIDQVGWPQSGEIDFMEFVGREPNQVFGTIHGPGYSGGASFGGTYDFAEEVPSRYRTFTVDWEPNKIVWYVDGIKYHEATPTDVAPNEWVFNQPFYLLMNVAVGGNFGGPVGEETTFPQAMAVDYVRVYQRPDTVGRFETAFVQDFSGGQRVTLPFDTFSRSLE